MHKLMLTGIIFVNCIMLCGCANMAVTSAQAVYNHQSLQKNFSDQYTTMKIYQALKFKSQDFTDANVAIATFNGEVLLAGQVPNAWQKAKATEIVKRLPNVAEVYNLLTVSSPASSITKLSDSWITAKVKAKLIASNAVDATKVKVVTENGTVYLMGILHPSEAEAAVKLASTTDGVQGVVKIFSYLELIKKGKKVAS